MKIVITGGLGYIGTELCKLYSGETRYKKIVVTDERFVSERVKQLRDWGFEFIQTSILNKDAMAKLLKDADIVHHLAGITDVAYTQTQSDVKKDKLIRETAIEGTKNILNYISSTCKIIFPSTHVVYEGFPTTKFDIEEDEPTYPILTYAKSKVKNEIDIKESGKDYVILRLASVYGYSTDTMRINIMPNLFSKMASQNYKIKLFAGGIQYKSVVNLIDVARAFKFMAESNIKNEVYHLSHESTTVKKVAELCKKYNPKVELISTDDEIPNLGYTISNKKLLSTGYKFLYNIEDSIKEMIHNWSERDSNTELEYIIKGSKEYVDNRGKISNYELTEPINLIGYITSKAGTVRANHYHPIQEQKCLLVKGKYVSVIKDLSDDKAPIKTQIIKEGDIAVIKPNVAHAMVFLKDSIFLNLVRGEREHKNYGVTHTIEYKLVDEEFRNNIIENYHTTCRSCGGENILPAISLGLSPLANNLLDSLNDKDELYPLELMYCPDCYNVQLSYIVPPEKMFSHYLYVSSTAKSFREHFEKAAEKYIEEFKLNSDSFVIDIGSNDGIALRPLKEKGIKILGIEPASNIAKLANDEGLTTINDYFNTFIAGAIEMKYGKANLITASNVFAHSDKLKCIADDALSLLKEDGAFIIEVQYLLDTIKDLTFDNIYHEHVNYWSVTSLVNFFNKLYPNTWKVNKIEHIDTHGGSIRVYIRSSKFDVDNSVNQFLQTEIGFGIKEYNTYLSFAKRVEQAKLNVNKNIKAYKDQGLTLVGYGSPAKATTALNYYGVTSKDIDYIVEDNKLKHNKILPGCKIPIYSKDKLNEKLPDIIIVMAWNFFDDIKKNNQELIDKGVKFISIKDLQND
jgi:nucleoside-diphosphate-sugar epimerase/dTDP-4-dehydrorhamnose 3,5-epimerase-like enzyme/2-polyprenyl-3-methyl-5-hydroxy-6-metoxy-1,4-benzoquinol methylase